LAALDVDLARDQVVMVPESVETIASSASSSLRTRATSGFIGTSSRCDRV
jgi:hypothetical protein